MFDFDNVVTAGHDERVRAWSVERSIEILGPMTPGATVVSVAKIIEDYVRNGDVTNFITHAVQEGYQEGRFEVKEAIERECIASPLDLDDLFKAKGWIDQKGHVQ